MPLGPLESLDVYSSDTEFGAGWDPLTWGGKSHALGCRYADRLLRQDDGRMTLSELLPIIKGTSEHLGNQYLGNQFCSHCGGFAVRALSAGQLEYYVGIHKVWDRHGGVGEWLESGED